MRADYPYLCKIDDAHYLCSYEGPGLDGWAVVLNVELPGVGVAEDEIISNIFILSNYPNPFNPTTTIFCTAKDAKNAKIEIYNLKGQKVKTFPNLQINKSSNQQIIWNGTDENNQPVGSGVYLYKLKIDDQTVATKKCLLLK